MKKIILVFTALVFGLTHNGQAQNQDELAIKKLVIKFETIFNQKDEKGAAKFWAEDGDFVNYLGILLHGREQIEKYHQTIFTQFYQTAQNRFSEPSIRFLKPDIAAVDVKWEVTGATSSDGKPMSAFKGIMIWTMAKENGDWFIKIMHNLSLPE